MSYSDDSDWPGPGFLYEINFRRIGRCSQGNNTTIPVGADGAWANERARDGEERANDVRREMDRVGTVLCTGHQLWFEIRLRHSPPIASVVFLPCAGATVETR